MAEDMLPAENFLCPYRDTNCAGPKCMLFRNGECCGASGPAIEERLIDIAEAISNLVNTIKHTDF